VPGLKETQNLINADTISQMKPGVRIINCSRGNVVNLDDLYEALLNGHVGGAALDVLPHEPPDPSLPILQHPKVIFTPHLGASTAEAQDKVASMIANQISAYLLNDVIINAVNFPSVSRETMSQLRPYLDLAEKMGGIMGQLSKQTHDLSITYTGHMAQLETKPLTHAILKGLLSAFTDGPVNYVNAPALAHDKGIHFTETTRQTKDDFAGTIRVKLEGLEEGPDEIWGTVFSKTYPRIVKMGEIYMDAIPEGSMIIIQNIDRPGVIGNVGTLLGKHQINIGRFQLGRRDDRALCMVNVDTPVEEAIIEELRQLPNILNARQIQLG
jgi:D-3-phosphoglycerate dehydrogenase